MLSTVTEIQEAEKKEDLFIGPKDWQFMSTLKRYERIPAEERVDKKPLTDGILSSERFPVGLTWNQPGEV